VIYLLAGMMISLYLVGTTDEGRNMGVDDAVVIALMWPLVLYFMASRGK